MSIASQLEKYSKKTNDSPLIRDKVQTARGAGLKYELSKQTELLGVLKVN